MHEPTDKLITGVLERVLKDVAFMTVVPDSDPGFSPPPPWMQASVGFSGPEMEGEAILACSQAFQSKLATNFLVLTSENPSLGESDRDAMNELIRVCCVNLLIALFGSAAYYRMSPSNLSSMEPGDWEDMQAWLHICSFKIEGHPVLFGLRFSRSRPGISP